MSSQIHSWSTVPMAPDDPILYLNELFNKDNHPKKVNLGVGAYKDENGNPWVLPSITISENLRNDTTISKRSHEYLPIDGNPKFVSKAIEFAYGNNIFNSFKIASCQTVSGSGACRLAAEFLLKFYNSPVYIPNPSWPNHMSIFIDLKFDTNTYRYWNYEKLQLDFDGLLLDIESAPNNSIFVLHACAHNPTGCDPTKEQWIEIEKIFKKKNHFAFFDMAYQGFASGDSDNDAWAVRYFVNQGHRILLCQSFAKNMGLYGQRVGTLSFVCDNEDEQKKCTSQLKSLTRLLYSSPPRYGSEIASIVFNNDTIFAQWQKDISTMSSRTTHMRETLYSFLKDNKIFWDHILLQRGMFAFTGLSEHQVDQLREEYHIYMTRDGRISIPGLNNYNVKYVADSIAKVCQA